jgi:hypothetical protein
LHAGGAILETEHEEIRLKLHSCAQFSSPSSGAGLVDAGVHDHPMNGQWLDESGCVLFRTRNPAGVENR